MESHNVWPCVWLLSRRVMFSGLFHAEERKSSFLFTAERYSIPRRCHIVLTRSSTDDQLGLTLCNTITDNAAVNTRVCVFLWAYFRFS